MSNSSQMRLTKILKETGEGRGGVAHTGWLLACLNPGNRATGFEQVAKMGYFNRRKAYKIRNVLLAYYNGGQSHRWQR